METIVMFVDCPGYMDPDGAVRCGLPAVVADRYTVTSTDGPLESARIRCPRGHYFNGPLESLAWENVTSAAHRPSARVGPGSAELRVPGVRGVYRVEPAVAARVVHERAA
jgi:hypothetical protein